MRKLDIEQIKNHLIETNTVKEFSVKQDPKPVQAEPIIQVVPVQKQNSTKTALDTFESEYEEFIKEQRKIIKIKNEIIEMIKPILFEYIDSKLVELQQPKTTTKPVKTTKTTKRKTNKKTANES